MFHASAPNQKRKKASGSTVRARRWGRVSPDGRWALASNRGHDSVAAFGIDRSAGRLLAGARSKLAGPAARFRRGPPRRKSARSQDGTLRRFHSDIVRPVDFRNSVMKNGFEP